MQRVISDPIRFGLLLLGLVLLAPPGLSAELYDKRWIEARSPAFVAYSTLGDRETVDIVRELEDFGQLVTLLTTVPTATARVPTYLYVFGPSARVRNGFGFSSPEIGGRFIPTMRANFATARRRPGFALTRILKHEYAHFLIHNSNGLRYPRWFDEGAAELLSTATIDDASFTFGAPDENRAAWLMTSAWLPYAKVLDSAAAMELTRSRTAMFYAQSWALAHLVLMGPDARDFSPRMSRYLRLIEGGESEITAFQKAFDESVDDLERRVRAYLSKEMKIKKGRLKRPFDRSQVAVRVMRRDEIAVALGALALAVGDAQDSERFYRAALSMNPDNSYAMVGVADHLKFAGRFAEAEPLYRRAIERLPTADEHHLDFGEYWFDRARDSDGEEAAEFLRQARGQFANAFRLNEENPETLAMYGSTYMLGHDDPKKGLDTLELAHALLPSHPEIKLQLARLYMMLDRPDAARPLLRSIIAWSHGSGAEAAEQMLGLLERRPEAASGRVADDGAQ